MKPSKYIFFLIALQILTACDLMSKAPEAGGSSQIAPSPKETQGVMSESQARTFLKPDAYGIETYESIFSSLKGNTLGGMYQPSFINLRGGISYAYCRPQISGNETDQDGDKIPVSVNFNFACSGTYETSGTGSMQDYNDLVKAPREGFKVALTNFKFKSTSSSAPIDLTVNYLFDLHEGEGEVLNFKQEASVSGNSTGTTIETGAWLDGKVLYDSAANPFESGAIQFNGFYSVKQPSANFTVKIEADLTYGNCAGTNYREGDITFTDGAGNVLKISYDSCIRFATYNGKRIN